MKSTLTKTDDTNVTVNIVAEAKELADIKASTLRRLGKDLQVPGFREGKAPADMVEKHINHDLLLNEFLDDAMSRLYAAASEQLKLRPVTQPKVEMKKFVPFTDLEFAVSTQVIPPITLGDYKKLKAAVDPVNVTDADIDEVIHNLQLRMATKEDVERAAKDGDQVWIDFDGKDAKGEAIAGASGKDYPLALGSNTFIPGFESNLVGVKAGDKKEFTLEFPKDYGVKALQGKKVTFNVTVNKVQEVTLPEVDDKLAAEAGPFKTVDELRTDISKQLETEQQTKATQALQNQLIEDLISKSTVSLPETILEGYEQDLMTDLHQNLMYRGITYEEYLKQTEQTEEEHKKSEITPLAEKRAKAGIIMTEVADAEGLTVTPEEVETRITLLKGQYKDDKMQEQLNSEEAKRDIAAQLLSEKTIQRLIDLNTK